MQTRDTVAMLRSLSSLSHVAPSRPLVVALVVAGAAAMTACGGGGPKPNPVTPIAVMPVSGAVATSPATAPATPAKP